jgi:hypothetical protein
MWPSMLGLWKARRGRRAAVAAITPFVQGSRSRLNGMVDLAWLDAYMVGFMVMLITFVVRREVGILETQALGLVQCEAWGEITGMNPDLIGEEVLLLSAARHKNFEQGCRNAIAFGEALYGNTTAMPADQSAVQDMVFNGTLQINDHAVSDDVLETSAIVATLWGHCFDTQVTGAPLAVARQ